MAALVAATVWVLVLNQPPKWVESPSDPLVAVWSLCVFLACIRYFERPLPAAIGCVAAASFGIYVLHPVVLNVLYKVLDLNPAAMVPAVSELCIWALAFFGALAMTTLLKRIPLFKKIL